MRRHRAADLAASAAAAFRTRHRVDPVRVGRAPGRVNLIGDHTDYLGGLCLPTILPHATWAVWAPRTDGRHLVTSSAAPDWDAPVEWQPTGWAAYVVAVLQALGVDGPASVHVESTVPLGAGLSSSAALICAVALAVSEETPDRLVEPCIRAEQEGAGAPTGGLDQTVVLLGGPGTALLLDFTTGARERVPWDPAAAEVELLVVDTRTRHSHAPRSDTGGGYGDRRSEGERALADPDSPDPLLVRRRRHVASENERVRAVERAVRAGAWNEVGQLFTASHQSLRDDYEVSCPELDVAVDAALGAGALGARMTGGGFGGSVLALVARDRRDEVLAAVDDAFAARGWTAPVLLEATGGSPASRC